VLLPYKSAHLIYFKQAEILIADENVQQCNKDSKVTPVARN
jgi:hypothetical protein